ncbi:MAG: hypothetical protein AABM64_08315 [Pseudomonadota bacterium]
MPFTDQLLVAAGSILTAIAASVVAWYASRTRSGRLLRTVDQVTKLCDLTERLVKLQDSLTTRPIDDPARQLIQSCLGAVSDDFERERKLLPEFHGSATSFRKAMLLVIPRSRWLWPLQIAFHSMLILGIFVLLRAILYSEWRFADTVAIGLAMSFALLTRGLVALMTRARESAA